MQSYDSRNIYCEGYFPKGAEFFENTDLQLSFEDANNNIRLDLGSLGNVIKNRDDLAFDLIRISTYVYIADCKTKRGGLKNAYDEYWNANLNFYIPVLKPNFWNKKEVKELLAKSFNFAVGHNYTFNFVKWEGRSKQYFLNIFKKNFKLIDIDCISMFSGGLDSLYSSVLLLEEKRKPLLLSHRSTPKLVGFRNDLHSNLQKDYAKKIPKWEVSINNQRSNAEEFTQRSRSIVYACLGSAFAKCLNVEDVFLSDNGIVTFNLRSTGQNIGTLNTRSTNPKLISYVNQLNKLIWKTKTPTVKNKLLWYTKAEVIQGLKDLGKSKLLSMSTSCVSTKNLSKIHPYCGICSQCVDRRFSADWAKISEDDEPRTHYKANIFTDDLVKENDKGIGKTHAENYFRKASALLTMTDSDFLDKHNELYDFIPDETDELEFLKNVFDLHKRFATQVHETIMPYWTNYKKGMYPENSLVSMAFRESNNLSSINDYKIFDKKIIINVRKRTFSYAGINIDLTDFEFEFMLMLLKEPDATVSYDILMKSEVDGLSGYSTPAQTHKRNINKKIIQACKDNNIEISDKFNIAQPVAGRGYKVKAEFQNEIALQEV